VQDTTRIAVDIAKSVFEIAISDRPGHVERTARLRRAQFLEFFAQQPPATVVMEACGSSHHWARRIEQLGHHVILLPPHQVRPYVKRNKTDRTDAKGILEASRNEDIRPVPIKTVSQQVLTSMHRLRQGWMTERTARMNAHAATSTAPWRRRPIRRTSLATNPTPTTTTAHFDGRSPDTLVRRRAIPTQGATSCS
jgi:transposase